LHEFLDYQFAGVKCKLINYHDMPHLVDMSTEVSADQSEEPIGPVCEQADVDMLRVGYETGRLYTIAELTEPTSSSEPVEVNNAADVYCVENSTMTDVHCVENSIMTDISNKVLDVDKTTLKVGVRVETHLVVHRTSQVQQPTVCLVQCIADLASSEYDGGGNEVQSDDRTQLKNIINVVGTIVRAFEVQHTERKKINSTVNSFRTQLGRGVPAVVEVY